MDKKKGRASNKIDGFAITAIFSVILLLLFRIPLVGIIGDNGIAYFSVANEIFLISTLFISYGISQAVSGLVRYRMRREQFRNAQKILQGALLLTAMIGLSGALLVFFLAGFLANTIELEALSRMAVCVMAPALLPCMMVGVFRGYFQGIGTRIPTMHSRILIRIILFAGGLLFAGIACQYGEKVAALLQNTDYEAAYGAMGAALGIVIAELFGLIHMIFLYFIFRGTIKNQINRDNSKAVDGKGRVMKLLAVSMIPAGLSTLLLTIHPVVDMRLFYYYRNIREEYEATAAAWGTYYGKYMVVVGIAAGICCMIPANHIRKIMGLWDRDEQNAFKERLSDVIHQCAIAAVPTAIFTAVLAENILSLFYKGNLEMAVKLVQYGSVLIVLICFGYLFISLLQQLQRMGLVLLYGLLAGVTHLSVTILLFANTSLELEAVICGNIAFCIVLVTAGFLTVMKLMHYRQEWFRTFGITILDAAIAGLIMMLLNKALLGSMGALLSGIICLAVGVLIYLLALILLKGVNETEWSHMAGGRFMIVLGKMLHLM